MTARATAWRFCALVDSDLRRKSKGVRSCGIDSRAQTEGDSKTEEKPPAKLSRHQARAPRRRKVLRSNFPAWYRFQRNPLHYVHDISVRQANRRSDDAASRNRAAGELITKMTESVNKWRSVEHAMAYLERTDSIPHRVEGEAALLDESTPGVER